jgi:hypothetical protein
MTPQRAPEEIALAEGLSPVSAAFVSALMEAEERPGEYRSEMG